MTEKQLKGYVLRLYKYKKISDKQFRNAVDNLEQLKENDPIFYYFNMGKLHTAFGNVEDAKEYLGKTIMLKPDHSSAYYNLFKCYVKCNDIEMARVCFNNFLHYVQGDVNFEFAIRIMDAINSIDKDFFDYSFAKFVEHGYEVKDITQDIVSSKVENIKTEYEKMFEKLGIGAYGLIAQKKPLTK